MVLIDVHGYNHSPDSAWHPYLHSYYLQKGWDIFAPQFPGGKSPVYREWEKVLDSVFKSISDTEEVVLIGHSLGTRAIQVYLFRHLSVTVSKVVLIAPFDDNPANAEFRNGQYANFFEERIDFNRLIHSSHAWSIVSSQDDDRIPFYQAQNLARALNADLMQCQGYNHFLDQDDWKIIIQSI